MATPQLQPENVIMAAPQLQSESVITAAPQLQSESVIIATPQPQPGSFSTPLMAEGNRIEVSQTPCNFRLQEKAELQNLNDRLACYIDCVRKLETENGRLSLEVQALRDAGSREITKIKAIYETELKDARLLIDDTAREKAKLEMDVKRLYDRNEELKAMLDKSTQESKNANDIIRKYEVRTADLKAKYEGANAERTKAVNDLNEIHKEIDHMRELLNNLRKSLEEETLVRIDLENTIQTLREELAFKDQIHAQELSESRSNGQHDISTIDGRLSKQYEAKLQNALQELREQYESQLHANRNEIELLYETQLKNLQAAANRKSNVTTNVLEELRTAHIRIKALLKRIDGLEGRNRALTDHARDFEQLLENERARYNADIANLEADLQQIRNQMAKQLQEYKDLLDVKVSLDLEISAYGKLLGGEESRLNITPITNTTSSSSVGQRVLKRQNPTHGASSSAPVKRRRIVAAEPVGNNQTEYFIIGNTRGDVHMEVDKEGKFVKLFNRGSKEIQLGGWQILHTAGEKNITLKFARNAKIAAGATITVWSADVGATHDLPNNIVMKTEKWFVADNMKTTLLNGVGVEVASSERIRRKLSKHASRRPGTFERQSISAVDGANREHIFEQAQQNVKSCLLM